MASFNLKNCNANSHPPRKFRHLVSCIPTTLYEARDELGVVEVLKSRIFAYWREPRERWLNCRIEPAPHGTIDTLTFAQSPLSPTDHSKVYCVARWDTRLGSLERGVNQLTEPDA